MAGLFGFFGKKSKKDQTGDAASAKKEAKKEVKTYFLDADQAKTFGNIDYMRTVKSIRRTFPKTVGNGREYERTVQISALGTIKYDGVGFGTMNGSADPSTPPQSFTREANGFTSGSAQMPTTGKSVDDASERRRKDTSMDMFRNMAKDIRKR
ncbi:MAG: hypothetical protein KME20_25250 [Kaiparowitsia implicata GSE-PSE-MK54-09C]|jgi:hypothetical protein|nr:hypothetical protein [Kaiparowitsia implicata GSE-PSE-MK54-09C]